MGWLKGLEPSTSCSTGRRSNQLSYSHQISLILTFLLADLNQTKRFFIIVREDHLLCSCLPDGEAGIRRGGYHGARSGSSFEFIRNLIIAIPVIK